MSVKTRPLTLDEQKDMLKSSIRLRQEKNAIIPDWGLPNSDAINPVESKFKARDPSDVIPSKIVRSKGFDSSAKKIFPSQTIRTKEDLSLYTFVDRKDYDTPSDRIARFYNTSTCGLRMKNATKIAKFIEAHPLKPKPKATKPPLAPNALLATARIADLAASGGNLPKLSAVSEAAPIKMEESSSRINAVSRNKVIFATKAFQPQKAGAFNPDDWNPVAAPPPVDTSLDLISRSAMCDRMDRAIQRVIQNGVATAATKCVPLPQFPDRYLNSIISRLLAVTTRLDGDWVNVAVNAELALIEKDYLYACARGSVEYGLHDSEEVKVSGISLAKLRDERSILLWCNEEYQVDEWRLLRKTGIHHEAIQRIAEINALINCTPISVMLELQSLWLDKFLPASWWESVKLTNNETTIDKILLTNVNEISLRGRFPLSVAEFITHVDVYSKGVREGLTEFWLAEVGAKLSSFVASLSTIDCKGVAIHDEIDLSASLLTLNSLSESVNGGGLLDDRKEDKRRATKAMKQRLNFELETSGLSPISKDKQSGRKVQSHALKGQSKAERVLECSAVLLSRQLRGMCENSLVALVSLFESLLKPSTAVYSLFVVSIRSRQLSSREATVDYNEPTEAHLQPDLPELKAAVMQCIKILVASSRDFPRPENLYNLGTPFGGGNHQILADILSMNHSRRLNACSVSLSDEIVVESIRRVNVALDLFFAAPQALLDHFADYHELLSGKLNQRVQGVIDDCRASTDHIENLEKLGILCDELAQLVINIGDVVPDTLNFPAVEVRSNELKDSLIKYVRGLHSQVVDLVVVENRHHMNHLCSEYENISTRLEKKPIDAGELKELTSFTNKAAFTLIELADEYKGLCFQRIKFLLNAKHRLQRDDVTVLVATHGWPASIDVSLRKSYELQTEVKHDQEELLAEDQRKLDTDVGELFKRIDALAEQPSAQEFKRNCARSAEIRKDMEAYQLIADEISERENLLDAYHGEHQEHLQEAAVSLDPVERFWMTARTFFEKKRLWLESPISEIDAEDVDRTIDELFRFFIKIAKEFDRLGEKRQTIRRLAEAIGKDVKEFQNVTVPLMILVCNPGMNDRHWVEIERITGINVPADAPISTATLISLGLQNFTKEIEETCISASKEYSLGVSLTKMEDEWKSMVFDTKEYRSTGTRILSGVDEIQQLLDDQIVKIQAMRGSRYIKPFAARVGVWEETLLAMQDTLDNWLKVQATWLYLEPIFSSEDIMRQMPTEGTMFRTVDSTWRVSMGQTFEEPSCVLVARRPGFLLSLIEANKKLEIIQKGLNDYLETKRLAFPRFFFLSNDELLEILAETKDPLRVQPHLKKCFDGVAKLHFLPNLDISACYDPTGERLDFPYEKVGHRQINPNESGGNVERWLIEVEIMMKKSLAYAIDVSMRDFEESDRIEWLQQWQGQVVICVNQTNWCVEVETTLNELSAGGRSLRDYYNQLCDELMRTVDLVRGDIPKALRVSIGALVVMDVHNRDTVAEMVELGVTSRTNFDWLSQLRYYWNPSGQSAQTGLPGSVQCRMINALALYAYEYIGNQDRLVITPLTDRCYRTLMGAIHLNLGGAPEGPAGTGKTETTKDLAKAIAIQCVVTNCSDGLDYLAMAKFFKGLAASGAWACFDEFNRIQLEVLSVIAQQIMQIQQAKLRNLEKFTFEGTELTLKPTCCPFITMNPGYAGRAELPDNLKVLFRTVAMMVPDYGMISEIILYSYGYTNARPLAVKIVTTYKLCSEQLSSQSHYDYGMRAVIAVLRAAGNLRRSSGHLPEDVLVLRSIIDVNLPKFLSPDVPLFNGIVSDLFPGVVIDPPDRDLMKTAFKDVCLSLGLIDEEYFWEKVVQIYDMMVVRHGFMIVGLPFSGKSSSWKVLADVLGLLHERFPDDKRWTKVYPIVQNPKSISMGQLYGQFDAVSHEWADGVLAVNYRNAASSKIGRDIDRKWILFDGPVDAIWIENMNTVLDDNKKLCLMSGEIIAMTDVMSMIFEPMDLLVASPATVSRCGMIYMEPEQLGWKPLMTAWISTHFIEGAFNKSLDEESRTIPLFEADVELIVHLFEWLVDPCLSFVRKAMDEMSPTVDSNLVQSLLNIFQSLLQKALPKYHTQDHGVFHYNYPKEETQIIQRTQDIECCFFFALIWSVGKSGTAESQQKFSRYLERMVESIEVIQSDYPVVWNALQIRRWVAPQFGAVSHRSTFLLAMPMQANYYECIYDTERSCWKTWVELLPAFTIPPATPYSSIIIPNVYTAQYSFMLELLIQNKNNVLVCGPTGTGKSAYVNNTISMKLPQDKYKPLGLGFSAKTSAMMTQDIIDGKLDKRRKGVFGPALGQHCVIFVDDLNMPEVETYGAQPPIELLRQLIDSGGWYDLKEKSWRSIVDTSVVAAMGPAGGGRNGVTPRFLRHFNLLCFSEFDDATLKRIFITVISWHFTQYSFSADVTAIGAEIVDATLSTYRAVMESLLPTPQKTHYAFNLRDFSRVIQGVLLCRPSESFNRASLIRLWSHEALRVFSDRLIDDTDRSWFHGHLEGMCSKKFNCSFHDIFQHLGNENSRDITMDAMRGLVFGDFMGEDPSEATPIYEEIPDFSNLSTRMDEYLRDFNATSRKPMDLVLFNFAVEHVSRICRILRMPGGNSLLVGVGGSGRQSVSRLATHICGYNIFQIEISKNYTNNEWREDLKSILKEAGTGSQPVTFLFSDTQIKNETFVEDISNMLNSGEVPNIFPSDERASICEAVRPHARQIFGKMAGDMSTQELYAYFITRIKQNLHIVLAFSPIGDAFRERLRKFPALINCCTINWFTAWPSDALVAVARKFLSDVTFQDEDDRSNIVALCQQFHVDVKELSKDFMISLKRVNYVTPTSYLELILAFKQNLDKKRIEISTAQKRYEVGLEKLAFAAEQVVQMQRTLADLQPELAESAKANDALRVQIEEKMPKVMETRTTVSAEAAIAQREADIVQKQKEEVEADLAVAIPALQDALAALDTIKPNHINEIKALMKPPEKIKTVCRAVCVMLKIPPARIPDPADPSKRIMDYWGPSQKMLSDSNFLLQLQTYDKDNISPLIVSEIKKNFLSDPNFDPKEVANASQAAEGMCKWCWAMITYDKVAKEVAPKKLALEEAERTLFITMSALQEKKRALQKVEDDLAALQNELESAKQRKKDLEDEAGSCDTKIVRANQLLDGLGGERQRWGDFAFQLGQVFEKLTGDVLVSAGVLAYLGPFTAVFRQKQIASWIVALKGLAIPCSDHPSLSSTLGDPVRIRQWNIDGLPTDNFSVDNGIIVFSARRWPLMIDPQGQANKWIRNMEKSNSIQVIKLTDTNYLRTLENSITYGTPVLLENVGEELDPSLEPLLQKQLFKQGGVNCIRLGDSTIEYSDNFRFYITTKLRNPHYLPEVSVKVTLLNFMITPEGLQDQLLGIVVSQERPDLEEQRNLLIIESAENKRLLKEIEDQILHIMSSSSGNILEDETAISTLKGSKTLSDEISQKQAVAEETEVNINNVRQSYSPVAYSAQILFFCIADLAIIEPVYQYSLSWFIALFVASIRLSEKGRDVEKRLENLITHFTYSLYKNVCRSLLEKDKLLFSFLLTIRIQRGQHQVDPKEWFFLLTGGLSLENRHTNPAPSWLHQRNWDAICQLSLTEKYANFRDDFVQHAQEWKNVYDSLTPHDEVFPGIFKESAGLARLCALRTIRPDKIVLAVQSFVQQAMGLEFVNPPPFDLQACYNDSSAMVPLVFILSAGSDPMGAVLRAAEVLNVTADPISLGQGQGPKAERLIERAKEKGTWVVLQNCHLAPSWMTTLEKICEDLDPDETHPGFRLWCTTYPSDVFPVAVLQNGVKMTNEPPKGIRANLLGSFNADPIAEESFYSACSRPTEFRKLIFGLCFFHALVQERRLYGPLGWNIPYEFNESDMRISIQQLKLFLEENDDVPYKALVYTAGECNYGGRVTDDKDRRTLLCILQRFYRPAFLEDGHNITPNGVYQCPADGLRQSYIDYIDKLPVVATPDVFGLHDNATLTRDQNDTNALLNAVLDTEGGGASGGGSSDSKETIISHVASDIANKLPPNFDIEFAQLKYPVRWEESMNTVLCQELIRFNNLLSLIRMSLNNIQKGVKGLLVMSDDLEILGNSLLVNRLPSMWKGRSFPSLKPLGSYVNDLHARLSFFSSWLNGTPPPVFWLSSFFFTQAFLTGSAQNFARKYTIPIDDIVFDFEMMDEERYASGPPNGVYTYGLFLEGAKWNLFDRTLAESLPKVLFAPAPTMLWMPYRKADVPTYPHYKCPVYKTSDRRGILATTGHSSNFVCFINMPTEVNENHWVERGVAMLTQLDD